MLKVGLTGGIGSGKITVAEVFRQLGVSVYSSDDRAKALMSEDLILRTSLISLFGEQAFLNGVLNRSYIASKVFANSQLLDHLNALVHPVVERDFQAWCLSQKGCYIIKEAAILFESGANNGLDKVVLVEAPKELRINRVVKRDGCERADVIARIDKQWPDEKKKALSDDVIINDEKSSLLEQVLKLHNIFNDAY